MLRGRQCDAWTRAQWQAERWIQLGAEQRLLPQQHVLTAEQGLPSVAARRALQRLSEMVNKSLEYDVCLMGTCG